MREESIVVASGIESRVGTALLFESDAFKAWSIDLAPDEINETHSHALDHVVYTVSGATLEIRNPTGAPMRLDFQPGVIVFVPAGVTESAKNVGITRFLSIDVELKQPSVDGTESRRVYARVPTRGLSGTFELMNTPRVRASLARVRPSESLCHVAVEIDQLVVAITDGDVLVSADGHEHHEHRNECQTWLRRARTAETLRNVGTSLYEELLLEVK